jgi:hypothetical protein
VRIVEQPTPPPPPQPVTVSAPPEVVDPHQRWSELAMMGQYQGKIPEIAVDNSQNLNNRQLPTNETISVVNETPNFTPGTTGILRRQTAQPMQQIALGATAAATVSVPLIWDNASETQLSDRFALTLTDDLLATDGTVALKAGTVVVATIKGVNSRNYVVQAQAIALISQKNGQIQQQNLPENTILIQGEAQQPLIAQGYFDPGNDIATQDLLVSTLSGIGRIGEVFTEPEVTSTITNTINGVGNSTLISNRERQIWAAVLDGFFNPLAQRIANRSEQQIQELLDRPNLAVIPVGTPVSITVNGLLYLPYK